MFSVQIRLTSVPVGVVVVKLFVMFAEIRLTRVLAVAVIGVTGRSSRLCGPLMLPLATKVVVLVCVNPLVTCLVSYALRLNEVLLSRCRAVPGTVVSLRSATAIPLTRGALALAAVVTLAV